MAREFPTPGKLADVVIMGRQRANVENFDYFRHVFGKHVQTRINIVPEEHGISYEVVGDRSLKLTYDDHNQLKQLQWTMQNKRGNFLQMQISYDQIWVQEFPSYDKKLSNSINWFAVLRDQKNPDKFTTNGKITVDEKTVGGLFPIHDKVTYEFGNSRLDKKQIKALKSIGFDPRFISIMDMLGEKNGKEVNSNRRLASLNIMLSSMAGMGLMADYALLPNLSGEIVFTTLLFIFANVIRQANRLAETEQNTLHSLKNEGNFLRGAAGLGLYLNAAFYHMFEFARGSARAMKFFTEVLKTDLKNL